MKATLCGEIFELRCWRPNYPVKMDKLSDWKTSVELRLDGILDKTGHVPLNGNDLCFQTSACKTENPE